MKKATALLIWATLTILGANYAFANTNLKLV